MEATLLIKDTLNVTIQHDSLFHGEYPIVLCNKFLENPKHCIGDIWTIGILCCIILLLILYICYFNNKAKFQINTEGTTVFLDEEKKSKLKIKDGLYQELRLYRSQLANFLEKQTLKKETKFIDGKEYESIIREYEEEKSKAYIAKLESIISELTNELEIKGDSINDEKIKAEGPNS